LEKWEWLSHSKEMDGPFVNTYCVLLCKDYVGKGGQFNGVQSRIRQLASFCHKQFLTNCASHVLNLVLSSKNIRNCLDGMKYVI